MTVRVLFFAYLRERCGAREITVELPEGACVEDLRRELCARYQVLASERMRFALNQAYVDNTQTLHQNDEIALIPPVSGGVRAEPSRATIAPSSAPCRDQREAPSVDSRRRRSGAPGA